VGSQTPLGVVVIDFEQSIFAIVAHLFEKKSDRIPVNLTINNQLSVCAQLD
jgi:hypothetical protein